MTILIVVSIGLGVALITRHRKAVDSHAQDEALIIRFSNDWQQASVKLDDAEKLNSFLSTNISQVAQDLSTYSNNFIKSSADLAKLQAESKAAAEVAAMELQKRDDKIAQMEGERESLVRQLAAVTASLEKLNQQISQTEQQLATSEGDREFLLVELKRMQSEKAELERSFNDLALLRQQVSKLRDELVVARRLDWATRGVVSRAHAKGATGLMSPGRSRTGPAPSYDLNVEIGQDGSIKVVPATNAPPAADATP